MSMGISIEKSLNKLDDADPTAMFIVVDWEFDNEPLRAEFELSEIFTTNI